MQAVTDAFNNRASGHIRPVSHKVEFSFDKTIDPSINFFTLDTSLLDGPDLLAMTGANVLTEWNKYAYTDYSDRIVGMEWVQEFDFFYSLTSSMADITLNNYDGLFTKGSFSPIEADLLPRRPIRLQAGFGAEVIPQFVGLTEEVPIVNKRTAEARVHAIDFLSFLLTRRIGDTTMLVNQRVDQILTTLFVAQGVPSDQLIFDNAKTVVPYAYFEKDRLLGNIVEDLMKAEMGSIFMNEEGFIVFKNRLRSFGASVYTFNDKNIISYENSDNTRIINSVNVKGQVREVQPLQLVFNLENTVPFRISGSSTLTKFFQLDDPASSIETITSYTANSEEDGSGTDLTSFIDIIDQQLFSDTVLVEFDNTSATPAYITALTIDGTPVKVIKEIEVLEEDTVSIEKYDVQSYTIESKYIQDEETAQALALMMIAHFKEYGNTITIEAKGNMALQINDVVNVNIDGINDNFVIRKIESSIFDRFQQRLTLQKYEIPTYFILDQSLLDGEDVLAP